MTSKFVVDAPLPPISLIEGNGPPITDFVTGVLRIEPFNNETSGIVIKRPGAAWGDPNTVRYATGQFIEFLSEDMTPGGLTPRGAYSGVTVYRLYDSVSYGGMNYYSLVDGNVGNQPDVSFAQWTIQPRNFENVVDQGVYNAVTTYALWDRVSFGNVYYYSKQNGNTGNQPNVSPSFWSILNPGNALYRVDKYGGTGQGGGAHYAPGIHGILTPDYVPPTQCIWVNPFIDTVGLVITNPPKMGTPATPTSAYMIFEDVRVFPAYIHNMWLADGSYENNKAIRVKGRLVGDVPLMTSAIAGQTGDLLQARSSTGNPYFAVSSTGNIKMGGGAGATDVTLQRTGANTLNFNAGQLLLSTLSSSYFTDATNTKAYIDTGVASTGLSVIERIAANVPLVVKGAASQVGNLTLWKNSAGTNLTAVAPDGGYLTSGNSSIGTLTGTGGVKLVVQQTAAQTASAVLVVRGAASQSTNLQEWQNSTPTVLTYIDQNGVITAPRYSANSIASGTIGYYGVAGAASAIPFVAKGAASQTGDLQQWQDSTGAVLTNVASTGAIRSTVGGWSMGGASIAGTILAVNTASAANIGLTVRSAASQTANLQEWQSSTPTTLAWVTPSGGFVSNTNAASSFGGANLAGTVLLVNTNAAGNIGLAIKGAASQTADLQQWQDSTGALNTRINPGGDIEAKTFISSVFRTSRLAGAAADSTTTLTINTGGVGNKALVLKSAASQTADSQQWQDSTGAVLRAVTAAGLQRWTAAGSVQTTVGAAGAASALPATPTKYLKIVDDAGTTLVIPAYAAA